MDRKGVVKFEIDLESLPDCKYRLFFVPLGFTHIQLIRYQEIIIYTESNNVFLTFMPVL
jgi:hypothetical protein